MSSSYIIYGFEQIWDFIWLVWTKGRVESNNLLSSSTEGQNIHICPRLAQKIEHGPYGPIQTTEDDYISDVTKALRDIICISSIRNLPDR